MATYMDGPHKRKVRTKRKARTKKYTSKKSPTKVQERLRYMTPLQLAPGQVDFYVSIPKGLSMVNRKLFSAEYCYNIKSVRFHMIKTANYDTVQLQAITAGDTWAVHNAWTKGKALHTQMQGLVLEDNPSLKGKWAEFKVYLDSGQQYGLNLDPIDGGGAGVLPGEWNYTQFVLPQHDVDAATGEPEPAVQVTSHLLGNDRAAAGLSIGGRGLIKAYAESRATVQPESPNVPAAMSTSFFNLLTDSGSQEPELATVIEGENDQPPYADTAYPGADINSQDGWQQSIRHCTNENPDGNLGSFPAQCGLIHFTLNAFLNGVAVAVPITNIVIELSRGSYKGISAVKMGQ